MANEVYVDKKDCTSCQNCVDLLPEIFRMGNDDLSEVIPRSWTNASEENIQKAIDDCGGQCIDWK